MLADSNLLCFLQQANDFLVLTTTILYACYAFGVALFICELGQRLTNAFGEIGDVIADFDWYLFSFEIRKLLPTLLMVAQQPVALECFGSISGSRDTFKTVSLHFTFLETQLRMND